MENENMGPNIFETMPVGMLIWGKDILLVFGASKDTIRYAVDYMQIYCLGTVFIQLSLGLNTFITAQGFAKTSMINMTIGAVINIILDPTMIYGCDLGIKGAAIATVIAQAVSSVFILPHIVSNPTIGVFLAEPIADFVAVCTTGTLFYKYYRIKLVDKN